MGAGRTYVANIAAATCDPLQGGLVSSSSPQEEINESMKYNLRFGHHHHILMMHTVSHLIKNTKELILRRSERTTMWKDKGSLQTELKGGRGGADSGREKLNENLFVSFWLTWPVGWTFIWGEKQSRIDIFGASQIVKGRSWFHDKTRMFDPNG